jgi:hypothetical protein
MAVACGPDHRHRVRTDRSSDGRGHHPPGGSLEAFVVALPPGDHNPTHGVVQLLWKAQGIDDSFWHRPFPLTDSGSCPILIGNQLAAVHYPPAGTLEVLFVDSRGVVRELWKRGIEAWQPTSLPLTLEGFASSTASVAVAHHPPGGSLEAFVVGPGPDTEDETQGVVHVLWKAQGIDASQWHAPFPLTDIGSCPVPFGARLSAVHHPPGGTLEVFFVDSRGAVRGLWKRGIEAWQSPPHPLTSRIMQVTGGPAFANAAATGTDLGANTAHRGNHWVFFGDVPRRGDLGPPMDADVVAFARRMTPDFVELAPVLGPDGLFAPFAIRRPDVTFTPQSLQTPTGAFSHGDKAYVFVLVHEGPNGEPVPRPVPGGRPVSYLTASPDPLSGAPYDLVFRWAEGKFFQVAPWVVMDPAAVGLPPGVGQGVVLLGHGSNPAGGDAVHLAWLPLPLAGDARASIRYYNGERDPRSWSPDLAAAKPLWQTLPGYTSLSVAWFAGPGRWVALCSKAFYDPPNHFFRARGPVVARVAPDPVALGSASEIALFDPCREWAYGRYMHWPDLDQLHLVPPDMPNGPGWAYGAHLLAPLASSDRCAQ